MGKQSRIKRERRDHSTLQQHKQHGRTLVPPLATLPLQPTRWSDVMLPELLWAALLLTHGPRLDIIELLRGIGTYFRQNSSDLVHHHVTLSEIARLPDIH